MLEITIITIFSVVLMFRGHIGEAYLLSSISYFNLGLRYFKFFSEEYTKKQEFIFRTIATLLFGVVIGFFIVSGLGLEVGL
jgi:hypothetical protein